MVKWKWSNICSSIVDKVCSVCKCKVCSVQVYEVREVIIIICIKMVVVVAGNDPSWLPDLSVWSVVTNCSTQISQHTSYICRGLNISVHFYFHTKICCCILSVDGSSWDTLYLYPVCLEIYQVEQVKLSLHTSFLLRTPNTI